MAPAKKKDPNPSGLGRAIINQKSKDARYARETHLYTTDLDTSTKLRSVTQEKDLDEFLNTAHLAGTEFAAEKRNVIIVQSPLANMETKQNPFLLSEQDEKQALGRQEENRSRLRVPRRPPWKKTMTSDELDKNERVAFLEWRRGLAQLQEEGNFLLTPFERNLEVWRQLWRVVERSHLVVQIVDARNPLRFRCEDLESFVQDVEGSEGEHGTGAGKRRSLLLVNKADLLTATQRRLWADYFASQGIRSAFYSAANATAIQQSRQEHHSSQGSEEQSGVDVKVEGGIAQAIESIRIAGNDEGPTDDPSASSEGSGYSSVDSDDEVGVYVSDEEWTEDAVDPRINILSVSELEQLFVCASPVLSEFAGSDGVPPEKLVVGLVGYPNVGKSSTINSLLGEKKVSVSATPGKTKHFQTINLSPTVVLCDCPGLVFPQFATTKAELVCDGVLPIDQLREYTGPTSLVVKRIPASVLEATYGLNIPRRSTDEGGDGMITAEDLLIAYAIARGFARSGQGNPDEARAARYILKDYVNAKLLYSHPPPGVSDCEFNQRAQELALKRILRRKRAPVTRVGKNADTYIGSQDVKGSATLPASAEISRPTQSRRAHLLDESFFVTSNGITADRPFVQGTARHGQEFSRGRTYPHQNLVADDGRPLTGRQARIAAVLTSAGAEDGVKGKKHFKGNKRVKHRSGKGYD